MNAVTKIERQEVAAVTPMQMLQIAVERGADLEQLQRLMDLQDRWEATQARKAFVAAMSAFKADPPTLTKNKHVQFETGRGKTEYWHATHDQVCEVIGTALSRHGLSHRWNVEQGDGGIRVTCILTHVDGHSESVAMQSGADESGGKNKIQAIASAVTYLQRYTLLAITGLGARDMPDDDGRGAEPPEYVSDEQEATLAALIEDVGADKAKFLKYLRVESLADLPASQYGAAVKALEAKRKAS